MLHRNVIEKSGFRILQATELEVVSGGVVSFRDGSAQRLRQERQELRDLLSSDDSEMSGTIWLAVPTDGGESIRTEAPDSAAFVVSEDVDGDGEVDGLTFLDEDGNYISMSSLNETFDNYIDTNLVGNNLAWHSSATTSTVISGGDGDGSFYGGFGIAGGVGGMFGLSEGGNTGTFIAGVGTLLEFGYSSDDDRAAVEADNSELTLPGLEITFDWPVLTDWTEFTFGLELSTGIFVPLAELHSNDEPDPDGSLPPLVPGAGASEEQP